MSWFLARIVLAVSVMGYGLSVAITYMPESNDLRLNLGLLLLMILGALGIYALALQILNLKWSVLQEPM